MRKICIITEYSDQTTNQHIEEDVTDMIAVSDGTHIEYYEIEEEPNVG